MSIKQNAYTVNNAISQIELLKTSLTKWGGECDNYHAESAMKKAVELLNPVKTQLSEALYMLVWLLEEEDKNSKAEEQKCES